MHHVWVGTVQYVCDGGGGDVVYIRTYVRVYAYLCVGARQIEGHMDTGGDHRNSLFAVRWSGS